jgi:hypothetical protein
VVEWRRETLLRSKPCTGRLSLAAVTGQELIDGLIATWPPELSEGIDFGRIRLTVLFNGRVLSPTDPIGPTIGLVASPVPGDSKSSSTSADNVPLLHLVFRQTALIADTAPKPQVVATSATAPSQANSGPAPRRDDRQRSEGCCNVM